MKPRHWPICLSPSEPVLVIVGFNPKRPITYGIRYEPRCFEGEGSVLVGTRLICRRARQVWEMVPGSHKWAFAGATLLMGLTSFTAVGVPVTVGRLVDDMSEQVRRQAAADELLWTAGTLLGVIAALVLVRELFNVLRRYLVENTCTRIDKHLSIKVLSHLLRVELASLTHEKIGSLNGRIFRSVEGAMRFLRAGFLDFFPAGLTGLMALVVAFCKAPWMALVMAAALPVSVALTARQLLSQKDIRLELIRNREELDGTVVELLGGLDYVRVADTHAHEVKRFARYAEKRRRTELKHHLAMAFFGSAKALTEGFFHLVVLASAVFMAVQGYATFGDILAFSALFLSVMTPMAEVHRILDEGHEASLRVGDMLDMLHQPIDPSYQTVMHRTARLDDQAPIIATIGLCAGYKTADGRLVPALEDISLQIRPGETVGVVGRSGCGKSTLIKVLTRIVHPCGGQVFIKGMPLVEVSRATISQLIGYVGQTPFLFSGTIEENIHYGCNSPYLPEDIRRAAQRACIHDEIMAMPKDYSTRLAERGANLSGGQRQRIALARIFLKDPPILILDEATSALDAISERIVQDAIDAARADRTVIMIAHRLSTLSDADRILVFEAGRLREEGSYQNLVQKGGVFTELVMSAEKHSPIQSVEPAPLEPQLAVCPAPGGP
jgi:ATP-binding cassette, subfamily B, bacterial